MENEENGRTLLRGVSSVDLETPIDIWVDPNTNAIIVEVG